MKGSVLNLRLDANMRAELETAAARRDVSVSELARLILSEYLGSDGGRGRDVIRAAKYLRRVPRLQSTS